MVAVVRGFPQKAMIIGLLIVASGCAERVVRETVAPKEAQRVRQSKEHKYLKAHLRDGNVLVFSSWSVDAQTSTISGEGELRDFNRTLIRKGMASVHLDSVALLETNKLEPASTGMVLLTVASAGVSIACLANPKACFGSCPTFYVGEDDTLRLVAEGFSSSILPSLEATDIDMLYGVKPKGSRVTLTMTNEALETHAVRSVNLLAVAKEDGERVFVSPHDEFYRVSDIRSPSLVLGPEGECSELLRVFDERERFSQADAYDLAVRETLTVAFNQIFDDPAGIILGFRETLMSTYLFYQTLAYFGDSAGEWLAQCERDPATMARLKSGYPGVLGGIELFARHVTGEWIRAGTLAESGPIARNLQIIPLPFTTDSIRIILTRGRWRLDYVAMGKIVGVSEPIRIVPSEVLTRGERNHEALQVLTDSRSHLATLPGDVYTLVYDVPSPESEYELFLESTGYYLEWLRDEWKAEENLQKALMAILDPQRFLKEEAPRFKAVEPMMEETFWRSKYAPRLQK